MTTTRSSQNSQESPKSVSKTGTKRASDSSSSPTAKRGKTEKEQQTIEETMKGIETVEDDSDVAKQIADDKNLAKEITEEYKNENGENKNEELEAREAAVTEREEAVAQKEKIGNDAETKSDVDQCTESSKPGEDGNKAEKNAFDEVKSDAGEVKEAAKEEESNQEQVISNTESIVEDPKRDEAMPSSILEKGIIYFFFRGRVGIEDPQSVDDIARSYIVLRPLPLGAKLGSGLLEDSGDARLLALPKKILPKSKRDRFLMFVEKAKSTVKDLKEDFIAGSEYATKTTGTSSIPAATPIAEGVYAITTTGRNSHLVYHVTVPELGEVQKDIGLNQKGSYVISVKNPTASGPSNATLDNAAEYPEHIMKKFRNLRWMPLEPELLNYERTQFLIIGEGLGDTNHATEELAKDKKDENKVSPEEEMEKLEEEDHDRVEHLKGDDGVFADLGLSSKEYPKMQTTW